MSATFPVEQGLKLVVAPCLCCGRESMDAAEYPSLGGRQVCAECAEAIGNAWCLKHIGNALTWPIKRRDVERYKKANIPAALRWAVFQRDNFTCTECSARHFLEAHHIIPESKGGPTTLENLTTHCRDCNRRKGNLT